MNYTYLNGNNGNDKLEKNTLTTCNVSTTSDFG